MAEAFFSALVESARGRAVSGGTEPAREVHWEVLEGMPEVGLELTDAPSTFPGPCANNTPKLELQPFAFKG